jgi:hypothetical protein
MARAPITDRAIERRRGSEPAADNPQATVEPEPQEGLSENLYLAGRPTLKQFLKYVKNHAVNPPSSGKLVEEWLAANEVVRRLEKEEAGVADNPVIQPVDPDDVLLLKFLSHPLAQNNFNTVPTEVAFVELDQMVVYQPHIDLTFVGQLKEKLGPFPTEEEIFDACLPCSQPETPVKWSRMHEDTYVFVSPSNDLRFLGAMPLQPKHINDYPLPGNVAGIIGLAAGFGSNFMNAVYADKRLILNNGSHRACALRELGVKRVPCIVQHVSSREELSVIACTEITDKPNFYLTEPRPPMLKDYFDPRLRKVMPVRRRWRQVTVKFEIDQAFIPEL